MTNASKTIIEFLNCDYELLKNEDKKRINKRFDDLAVQGKTEGFYPLIVIPSDPMTEIFGYIMDEGINDIENIDSYRQKIVNDANDIDTAVFLKSRFDEYWTMNSEGYDILGQFVSSIPDNSLYWIIDPYSKKPYEEVVIAKIPVKNPWELAVLKQYFDAPECPTIVFFIKKVS